MSSVKLVEIERFRSKELVSKLNISGFICTYIIYIRSKIKRALGAVNVM
jgi:hypothetical protein